MSTRHSPYYQSTSLDLLLHDEIVTPPVLAATRAYAVHAFDLSDLTSSRIGIACTADLPGEGTITTTRFARVDKLTADDRGLCVQVTYDDGEVETCHMSRVVYVDGKHVTP